MRHFVRENWIWIVAPILVFLAILAVALLIRAFSQEPYGVYSIS